MSIIDDKNAMKGNWWKPKQVNDQIEGTLIGKRMVPNSLGGGEQNAYDLKVKESLISEGETKEGNNEVWTVFGKPGIDAQMRYVKLGQVIGFKFTEKIPAKRPGMNDTHKIQVYADATVVDEEWMQSAEAQEAQNAETPVEAPAAPANAELTTEQKIEKISEIANQKWKLTDPEQVKTKVMEETNLAFVEANLNKIIEAIA